MINYCHWNNRTSGDLCNELNTKRPRPPIRRVIISAWIWQHGPWEKQRGREKERSGNDEDVIFDSFFGTFLEQRL